MISLESLKCPACGADVPVPPPGATSALCGYCGHTAQIHRPSPVVAPPRAPSPDPVPSPPRHWPVAAPTPRKPSVTKWLVLLVVFGAIGGGIFLAVRPSTRDYQWRTAAIPASIHGNGVEDYLGLYASRDESDYPIYLAAFDGTTRAQIWRSGPYGKSAYETVFAVVGRRVVLADPTGVAHVIDLATGKDVGLVKLTDKAETVCSPSETPGSAWIATSDRQEVLIDVTTLAASPAPRPRSCASRVAACTHSHSAGTVCSGEGSGPKVDGYSETEVFTAGDDAISVGVKSPGTNTPIAVGFDPKTRAIRWQKPLVGSPPSSFDGGLHAVDLFGGRLIAQYVSTEKKVARLLALDAKTGATLWDVEVPNTENVAEATDITITPTRVYLPHWTWLDLYELKTGAHIATVGAW